MSLVGSATGIVRRNGDVYAIPHRVHATEIRYTKRPFTVSTYGGHFKAPEVHGGEKKLTPYHPLAPRSRPHIVFPRSKPSNTSQIVYVLSLRGANSNRGALYRLLRAKGKRGGDGVTVHLPDQLTGSNPVRWHRFAAGGNHTDARRFVSTHRAMYTGQTGDLPVGYGNQGIAAERTKWMHTRQLK